MKLGRVRDRHTVALAETGAQVVAVDIEEHTMEIAKTRCRLHGLERVEFICDNAVNLPNFSEDQYDLIIFFASLEHMTHSERILSLKTAWDHIQPNGILSVVDTPNRLWFWDHHTALLPFYNWLPDGLAIDYAGFSSRDSFRSAFDSKSQSESELLLARLGRGVSYHEFEIALGELKNLNVVSCSQEFLREKKRISNKEWLKNPGGSFRQYRKQVADRKWNENWLKTPVGLFHQCLKQVTPSVPAAFLFEELCLSIKK